MGIEIQNKQRKLKVELKTLRQFLQNIALDLAITDKELSVVLVSDKRIAQLNQQYRKQAKATDVLAFAMQEGEFSQLNPQLLGDVVISVETAQRQAQAQPHSLIRELQILTIHGVLHLLGYDHVKDSEAEQMQQKEQQLLKWAN